MEPARMSPANEASPLRALTSLHCAAISFIKAKDFPTALEHLKKAEGLLGALPTQGPEHSFVFLTLYNTALCYQRLGKTQECMNYLDGCSHILQQQK